VTAWDVAKSTLFGTVGLGALVGVAEVIKRLGTRWLEKLVDASVDERLAEHQLELDKDLEKHKSTLGRESERLRTHLQRVTTDYAIWAQRRHEAIARLFEEFLRLEVRATLWPDITPRAAELMHLSELSELVNAFAISAEARSLILNTYNAKEYDKVDHLLKAGFEKTRKARVVEARDGASEAYYAAALYLPERVDDAAKAVKEKFHDVMTTIITLDERTAGQVYLDRSTLRGRMEAFLVAAREELGESAATTLAVSE